MQLYWLSIILWFNLSWGILKIRPQVTNKKPNLLRKVFNDLKGEVYVAATIDDVTPRTLSDYGVVKVLNSSSVIVNCALADSAMSDNYDTKYGMLFSPGDFDKSEYSEVNFSNVTISKDENDWVALSSCRHNGASTSSSYSQGWSIGSTVEGSVTLNFAQIFGIQPSAGVDFSSGNTITGTVTCNVNNGSTLQIQMRPQSATISNIKERTVTIKKKSIFSLFSSSIEFGAWEESPPVTLLIKENIQIACVTDPDYLMCDI